MNEVMRYAAVLLLVCASVGVAEDFEVGGVFGYGFYRDGTIYAPGGTAQAGIRNRFAAGVVLGQDLYDYVSGEVRYVYHDGHPFIAGGGVKSDIQGQSQAVTYDVLFHLKNREHRLRPFLAAGAGIKGYVIAGPSPSPQALPGIGTLNTSDEWKFAGSVGGGVKYRLRTHLLLRADFRDYLTTFPKRQIMPAAGGTARGIFEQFTPMFGVSYTF
jgi:opacity protein-like surface antigen